MPGGTIKALPILIAERPLGRWRRTAVILLIRRAGAGGFLAEKAKSHIGDGEAAEDEDESEDLLVWSSYVSHCRVILHNLRRAEMLTMAL